MLSSHSRALESILSSFSSSNHSGPLMRTPGPNTISSSKAHGVSGARGCPDCRPVSRRNGMSRYVITSRTPDGRRDLSVALREGRRHNRNVGRAEISKFLREVHHPMYKVGRNDPCPCGSGLKYKKCCLGKSKAGSSRSGDERTAVGTALDWLKTNYAEELNQQVLLDYFGDPGDEELDAIGDLPDGVTGMLNINIGESLPSGGQSG